MSSPHEFPVAGSETLYAGRVMALRRDEVVMPGGRAAAREVVEHPGAVAVVPLDGDGSVVMIHQYRHPLRRRLWELPAGLLDEPGEDPVATAHRELREEAGLEAADWSLLVDVAGSPGLSDETVRVYLARGLTAMARPDGPDDEEAALEFDRVPLADAVGRVLAGEIVNGPTSVGLLAAHAVLTGAARQRPLHAPWPDRPTRFAARGRP
ncbi:MAG: NUDIX domain-containing protein [Pseudonocardiaceae bacterium]|nr:NUDIX domain-containing protein [Pseudonocardiaceae bacterium]